MAESDSWRSLALDFQSVPAIHEFSAYRHYYMGSTLAPQWQLQGNPTALLEFDARARRAAKMFATPPIGDLAIAWLEALWEEATTGSVRTPSEIIGQPQFPKEKLRPPVQLRGKIERVFQASSALCRKLESQALQAEFEIQQQNDPRNWSPVRHWYEVFKKMKELQSSPHEEIPEELIRRVIAEQDGIKPENVPFSRIRTEVAGLLRVYPAITLIPSGQPKVEVPEHLPEPTAEPTKEPIATVPPREASLEPRALRDRYLANFPEEKIKIRDICWAAAQHYREWKRWLAGQLKDGSTPDLAFRRVLTSGKKPTELKKQPRPPKWE